MPIFRIVFILFLTVPLLEIYLLLKVGGLIGPLPTVSAVVLTAIIGALLLRYQGLQTMARVQQRLHQGEVPAIDMLAGLILLIAGALLLTPGFFTDLVGFICLIPIIRYRLANLLLNYLLQNNRTRDSQHSVTLNGEFWEDKERKHLDR